MVRKRQLGRVNYLTVMIGAVVLGVIALAVLIFSNQSTPTTEGNKFLTALAMSDVDTLTNLSYYPGASKEDLKKRWTFTTNVAGKYYYFVYKITDERFSSPDSAYLSLTFIPDAHKAGSYEEQSSLPMVRKDGKWLVDVRAIDETIYPGLPR